MNRKQTGPDIMEWMTWVSKFIESHFKKILVLFFIAVVGAGLFMSIRFLDRQREEKSFNELFKITRLYREKEEGFRKALETKVGKPDSGGEEKKGKPAPPSGDLGQDYGDEVTKLENFLKENSKQRTAVAEAALVLSEIYSKYKMKDKAIQVLDIALKSWEDRNLLYYIMHMRLGNLWAANIDGCTRALSHWRVVGESRSFMASGAQLQMGLCLQKTGRYEEAGTWFGRIEKESSKSPEALNVKRYLRFLKFSAASGKIKGGRKGETGTDKIRDDGQSPVRETKEEGEGQKTGAG